MPEVLRLWSLSRSAAAQTPDTPERVRSLIAHPGSVLLLAEADDHGLVGTLGVGWDGWRGHMNRLAVVEGHRRAGIARRLVEAAHAHLRELGAPRVTALVGDDEVAARRMWLELGYELHEDIGYFARDL